MNKTAVILASVFILLLGCVGCGRQPREIDGLTEYSIIDLRDRFEATVPEQPQSIGSESAPSVLYFQSVSYNEAVSSFGSCVLRRLTGKADGSAYTAYRVKEGGVYYVLWELDENGSPTECIDRLYLVSLPEKSALKQVRIGDLYSKLAEIDRNADIVYRSAFDPIAYSLASNGKLYGFELDPSQGEEDEWPVVRIIDCTGKAVFPALLLKCDYPD